jgi:hypothetical protein
VTADKTADKAERDWAIIVRKHITDFIANFVRCDCSGSICVEAWNGSTLPRLGGAWMRGLMDDHVVELTTASDMMHLSVLGRGLLMLPACVVVCTVEYG